MTAIQTQAIIVAGGSGQRMNHSVPKQFLCIQNTPVLIHTLKAFETFSTTTELIIVIHPQYQKDLEMLLLKYPISNKIILVQGGATRFESVKNGTQALFPDSLVFVHDAVRCLLSPALIDRCYRHALQYGNAVPAIASKDSVRYVEDGKNHVLNRNQIRLIQTPQTFHSATLLRAFQQAEAPHFTDEANVVEAMGDEIFLVEGEDDNLKITVQNDLLIAEEVLKKRQQ